MHFEKKSPNYLLNGRYVKKEPGSRFGDRGTHSRALTQVVDDARSIASTASGRMSVATPVPGKGSRKSSAIKDPIYGDMPTQLNESQLSLLKKEFGINNSELTSQQMKFLKMAGNKRFSFPKRQRVNEDLGQEIKEQRNGPAAKMSGLEKTSPNLTRNAILERQRSEGSKF